MTKSQLRIVVIGASAGGLSALTRLIASLPADFSAAVFVVQHMAADVTGDVLVQSLAKNSSLTCRHASHESRLHPGASVLRDRIITS